MPVKPITAEPKQMGTAVDTEYVHNGRRSRPDSHKVMETACLAAQMMLTAGGEIYRVEETVTRICEPFAFSRVNVLAIPTGIFISLEADDLTQTTTVRRVHARTTNLSQVAAVNQIARDITQGLLTIEEGLDRLQALQAMQPDWRPGLAAAALSSGFFAMLFGGSWFEFTAAASCGLLIQLMKKWLRQDMFYPVIYSLLGGAIAALVASVFIGLSGRDTLEVIITGAMMPLVPGLSMTQAIRDTMRGDLVSGVARAAEAVLIAVAVAAGVGLVLALRLIIVQGGAA